MGILKYTVFIVVFLSAIKTSAQLSPGDLSEAHEHLEGLTNCTSCHELGEGPSTEKCLDCHKALNERIELKLGLHNIFLNIESKDCGECHSEHAGRDYELIDWPDGKKDFDHNKTSFTLSGKHHDTQCRDCHNPVMIKRDLKNIEPDINLIKTYFGLDTNCLSCHIDEHRQQLGNDCLKCHNLNSWKPVPGFSHDRTDFKLTGKHTEALCQKCHPVLIDSEPALARDSTYIKFSGIKSDNCTSCHKDVHSNKFGQDCNRCHVTRGWKILDKRNVDHSKTNFPLAGRHAKLQCDKCHKPNVRFAKDDYDQCLDCHKDPHNRQFIMRADNGICESCHSVNGFLPAQFTIEDHNKTEFPLIGAHMAQPCFVCHEIVEKEEYSYRNFKPTERLCKECHNDPHQGQFAKYEPVKECQNCHSISKWKDIKFNHNVDAKYPLEGSHKDALCDGCHKRDKIGDIEFVVYKPLDTNCKSCHTGKVNSLN
ncbi:MAG: cytochrome C [bacterium]